MTVVDTPDWSTPAGGAPSQEIGQPILTTGTLALGSDSGTARPLLVDSTGRLIISPLSI